MLKLLVIISPIDQPDQMIMETRNKQVLITEGVTVAAVKPQINHRLTND